MVSSYGEEGKILAGGQSLIPLLKSRLFAVPHLIDIGRIEGMRGVTEDKKEIHIGPLTTISEIESDKVVREHLPALGDASSVIADPLIRNAGTVGGNVCHGDPSNDIPAVMHVLGANFVLEKTGDRRISDVENFFVDTLQTDVRSGEILTGIVIPNPPERSGSAYLKAEKRAGDFSLAGVAVYLELGKGETVSKLKIALTSSGPKVMAVDGLDAIIHGNTLSPDVMGRICKRASSVSRPVDDVHGTAEYKRNVVSMLTGDAIKIALDRAKGGRR